MAEADAKATVAALKDAALIKSRKADWRLVAAAQVMLRGEHPDEFAAAAAMGKPVKQRREVSNWLDKLRELERTRASLRSQPGGSGSAAGSSLLAQVGSSLLAQPCWIDEHAPGVEQRQAPTRRSSRLLVQHPWVQAHLPGVQVLEPPSPVPTAHGHHATRRLAAVVSTPGGSVQQLEGEVSYTLPPADGESGTAAKRRDDRHRRREEAALRRFDISGCAVAEQRSKVLCSMRAAREVHSQISELLRVMVTEVERLNGWTEDHGFHWLPLSPLQLLHWPSKMGYTHGQFGMPLCQGDWAWLVDPQNDRAPRLASVSRWFSNGHVEFNMLSDDMRPTELPPVVLTPEPGVVLPLDERRPRYVGERVRLWGKHNCAAIRGTSDDVERQERRLRPRARIIDSSRAAANLRLHMASTSMRRCIHLKSSGGVETASTTRTDSATKAWSAQIVCLRAARSLHLLLRCTPAIGLLSAQQPGTDRANFSYRVDQERQEPTIDWANPKSQRTSCGPQAQSILFFLTRARALIQGQPWTACHSTS